MTAGDGTPADPHDLRVGWIGLGAMGVPMAGRLLAAGFPLQVWARRPGGAAPLVDAGARQAESPAALAAASDIVCTMVTGPDDVAALHAAMLPAARPQTLFVDLTTASPALAESAWPRAAASGVGVLDAPVTGGVAGARAGTLTVFVGGEADALARCRPVLTRLAHCVVHCGGAGAGYRAKLVNQTMMAGVLLGLASGVAQLRAMGRAPPALVEALGSGSAASSLYAAYAQRMLDQQGPETFTLGLLRKDLSLARDEALRAGVGVAFVEFALSQVDAACRRFGPQRGVQLLAA